MVFYLPVFQKEGVKIKNEKNNHYFAGFMPGAYWLPGFWICRKSSPDATERDGESS